MIIDWMTGCRGLPAADAARTLLIFRFASLPPGTGLASLIADFRETYLDVYLRLSGMAREAIDAWELPVAAARLTEAVPREEKERLAGRITELLAPSRRRPL